MRGKQGDTLSIQGDFLYDWAKIYQSLLCYWSLRQSIKEERTLACFDIDNWIRT